MSAVPLRADQVRTLYCHTAVIVAATVVNAALVVVMLWPMASHGWLLAWAIATGLLSVSRVVLHRAYRAAAPPAERAYIWGNRFVVHSVVGGVLWGSMAALFYRADDPLSQLLVTFVIGGMVAGAAGTSSSYFPSFLGFAVPSLVVLIVQTLAVGDTIHAFMALMLVVFGAGLVVAARNSSRALTQAFRLNIENETLLSELSAAQETLREANRTLEQKVAERTAAFEEKSEALRSAQRIEAVGRLAGGVAHDFNNLLTVVLANASLLLETSTLDADSRRKVLDVQTAAERGADLVRQLLAFGRRQALAPTAVDLNRIVLELRPILSRLVTARIELIVSPFPRDVFVLVDRAQIEQVIVNLVTNARDAMPHGGSLLVSTGVAESAPGPCAVLTVDDTGVGMDADTSRRAFEPFFTTKSLGRGTGLGLATVHGIVEQSGGRIEVTSTPRVGTRFRVFLPLTHEPRPEAAGGTSEPIVRASPAATILLAEDNREVRGVTTHLLEEMGHVVLAAESGERAVQLARDYPGAIQLLVSDVVMGAMGGLDLARLLTRERPALRVLLISGYSVDHMLQVTSDERAFPFLQKPFSREALQARVSAILDECMTEATGGG